MIVSLQLATILISRSNVYLLGRGLCIWCGVELRDEGAGCPRFAFQKTGSVARRVPLNFHVKSIEVPLGLFPNHDAALPARRH